MTAQVTTRPAGPAPPVAPTSPARVAAVLAVLVALLGAVLGPTGQLNVLLGPDVVTVAAGHLEALTDGQWRVLPEGARVDHGTSVRAPDGDATLAVGGGTVDLAEGTRMTVDDQLLVAAGAVVVRSPRTVVGDGSTTAQGTDTWRYDATGRIGAYRGSATVTDAAGLEVPVRTLQEARVRRGVLAEEPRPYVYAGSDSFDRQYLGTAFDVDDYLAALRQGLQAQYGTAPQQPAFYLDFDGFDGSLVASLGDVGFDRVGGRVGPPADVLVAAVVTEALVVDAGLEPEVAAGEVRDLRLAGATWGLVVQGRDLDSSHVRAAADRALARRQLAEQQGTASPVADGVPGTVPDESDEAPQDDADADPDGGSDPIPAPDEPPPSSGESEGDGGTVGDVVDESGATELLGDEVGGLVDDVVDTTDEVVDDLVGTTGDVVDGLLPTSPTDSETSDGLVGGLVDDVGGVLDGTVDAVDDTVGTLLGGS